MIKFLMMLLTKKYMCDCDLKQRIVYLLWIQETNLL